MSANDGDMVSMEEGRTEKNGIREKAGETSKESNEIIEKGKELSNKGKEILKSLDNYLLIDKKVGDKEATIKPSIPKVPYAMRNNQNFKMYFEPKLVSIGPYHHEIENLKVTQEMKFQLAAIFIKEHSINKENLYLHIMMEIENLRRCYELDAIRCYDDEELAWIFLIDGCIVLHYIYVYKQLEKVNNKFKRLEVFRLNGFEIFQGISDRVKFSSDLLMLENQLPYQVLKLVINSSENSDVLMHSIQHFFRFGTYDGFQQVQLPLEDPPHLLGLARTLCLIQSTGFHKKSNFIVRTLENYPIKIIDILFGILSYLLFMLFHILRLHRPFIILSLHNITELKEAGIKFKPTNTRSLADISFSDGTLKLPSISVNKRTAFKFLNLVAYEMCLNSPENKFEVSAYVYFLASLIVQTEDVKELRNNKILFHFVDNDEEVVKIFRQIRSYDMIEPFEDNYSSIICEIRNHCSKKYNIWIAQLKKLYFHSPWSVIALVGAIIALSVTILQTVYTVLAYYKDGNAPVSSSRSLPST